MTFAKGLFHDLVERRLWPVALLLVVALLAVPIVLSDPAGETTPESASGSAPSSPLLGRQSAALLDETQPVVSRADRVPFRRRVRRLAAKNPFVQQAKPKPPASSEAASTSGGAGTSGSLGTGTGTGSVPPSVPGGSGGIGSQPTGPVLRKFLYTAVVKFGELGKTKKKTLEPTDSLPNDENAIVIYLGSDGKSALFLAKSGVTARGDGSCEPSDSNCAILRMRKGDVEFFEVPSGDGSVTTYELELTKLGEKQVSSSKKGSSSKKKASPSNRKASSSKKAARSRARARRARRGNPAPAVLGPSPSFFDTLVQFGARPARR
jgi:hypothetical protein